MAASLFRAFITRCCFEFGRPRTGRRVISLVRSVCVFMMTSLWSWVVATVVGRATPGFGCANIWVRVVLGNQSSSIGNESFSYGFSGEQNPACSAPGFIDPSKRGSLRACQYDRTAQPGPLAGGLPLRQRQKHGQERPQDYRAPANWLLLLRDRFHGRGDSDCRKWPASGCAA